jgi:hypothetical protein
MGQAIGTATTAGAAARGDGDGPRTGGAGCTLDGNEPGDG